MCRTGDNRRPSGLRDISEKSCEVQKLVGRTFPKSRARFKNWSVEPSGTFSEKSCDVQKIEVWDLYGGPAELYFRLSPPISAEILGFAISREREKILTSGQRDRVRHP